MSNSPRLHLPLVQAAQAQKHVTVNDALVRIDGLTNLTLVSVSVAAPPSNPTDGACYAVPASASGEWSAHSGKIAIRTNGGWVYGVPERGWSAWVEDVSCNAVFDGADWRVGGLSVSPFGALTSFEIVEFEHVISAGSVDTAVAAIPEASLVLGVTGIVTAAITGSLTSWRLGVSGSDNRYGSGLGLGQSSWVRGLSSSPLAYYSDTDLVMTAEGGSFSGGSIRLAVHLLKLENPSN